MKTVGIVAHSFEGAALCFITACREGIASLGPHMHPNIVMSAVPLGLSMPGWEADDHASVAQFLTEGVQMVADAGADFTSVLTTRLISFLKRSWMTCLFLDCTSPTWFVTN